MPVRKKKQRLFREFLKFLGPGFLVTIGFIDPGNWATNIAGGADFSYDLLWVITLSTLMLILIQNMSARLGIATGKSLAANIREHFPAPASALVGVTIVAACAATDVAELLGGAIGFNLLLGLPLWAGALLTVIFEVFFIVSQRYHRLEKIILGFLGNSGNLNRNSYWVPLECLSQSFIRINAYPPSRSQGKCPLIFIFLRINKREHTWG